MAPRILVKENCSTRTSVNFGEWKKMVRRNVISSYDPEGAALHELIEKLIFGNSSRNWFFALFYRTILRCLHVRIHDVQLHLQLTHSQTALLKMWDLSFEPELPPSSSFCGGLMSSLLIYGKETILAIKSAGLELSLKEGISTIDIASLEAPCASVGIYGFQLTGCIIQIQHLEIIFSSIDLLAIHLAMVLLSPEERIVSRSGKELWKIVSDGLGRFPLRKGILGVFEFVLLWLYYVRAYESLLSVFQQFPEKSLEENLTKLYDSKKHLSLLKHHLQSVNELEEKLPAVVVGKARKIARYRAFSCYGSKGISSEGNIRLLFLLLSKVILFFSKACYSILLLFKYCLNKLNFFLGSHKSIGLSSPVLHGIANDNVLNTHFCLSFEEVHINVCLLSTDQSSQFPNPDDEIIVQSRNLPLFGLVVRYSGLLFTQSKTEKSFIMNIGELKLLHFSASRDLPSTSDMGFQKISSTRRRFVNYKERKVVAESNPAPLYEQKSNSSSSTDNSDMFLKNTLENLWSHWMEICRKYEMTNVGLMKRPFTVCEIKSFLDPYLTHTEFVFQEYKMLLGKLNFDLDYASITSTVLLFRQIKQLHRWMVAIIGSTASTVHPSKTSQAKTDTRLDDYFDLFSIRTRLAILKVTPEKNIQFGALIVGPSILVSLQEINASSAVKISSTSSISEKRRISFLKLDLYSVEFAAWPSSTAASFCLRKSSSVEGHSEYPWSKHCRLLEIRKKYGDEILSSRGCISLNSAFKIHGFNICYCDLSRSEQSYMVTPITVTAESSICRDNFLSFSTSATSLSMNFSGIIGDSTVLILIDEFCTLLEVFESIIKTESSAYVNFDSITLRFPEDFMRKLFSLSITGKRTNNVENQLTESQIFDSACCMLDATINIGPVDIILDGTGEHETTEKPVSRLPIMHNRSIKDSNEMLIADIVDLPGLAIGFLIEKSLVQINWEGKPLGSRVEISGVQSVIYKLQSQKVHIDRFNFKKSLSQSYNPLHEFSLPCCIIKLQIGSQVSSSPSSSIRDLTGDVMEESGSIELGTSNVSFHDLDKAKYDSSSFASTGHFAFLSIDLGIISMKNFMKPFQMGACTPKKLSVAIYISEQLCPVYCKVQGGQIFLEASSLAAFTVLFKVYYLLSKSLLTPVFSSSQNISSEPATFSFFEGRFVKQVDQINGLGLVPYHTSCAESRSGLFEPKFLFLKLLTINICQFCFALSTTDENGGTRTLALEFDSNLKIIGSEGKILFELLRFTVTSYLTKKLLDQRRYSSDSDLPHFHYMSIVEDPAASTSAPWMDTISDSNIYDEYHILKHMSASLVMGVDKEKTLDSPKAASCWVGNGSISGFDITITLPVIQVLLGLATSLSAISTVKSTDYSWKESVDTKNRELSSNLGFIIPDGAVVAIMDFHQHMYFAVEPMSKNYHLFGTLHYSLVGEKALFMVRHRKTWGSRVSSFYLASLYAKNEKGEPLCLNFSPGSAFVNLSSDKDKLCALWHTFPFKPDYFEFDDDMNYYEKLTLKVFHLINQKNKCGVAFINGLPEFVKKPGNPFKLKIFNAFSPTDSLGIDLHQSCHVEDNATLHGETSSIGGNEEKRKIDLSHLSVRIDKATLTILHEVADENDKFPLFQIIIKDVDVIGHLLPSKFRIIGNFTFSSDYFDAQRMTWRELFSSFEMSFFFGSWLTDVRSHNICRGIHNHLFFAMDQVNVFLTELSLDMLLYIVGKLSLAGPYSIRSPLIFSKCCKMDNQSNLRIIFNFYDNKEVLVYPRSSSLISLRHVNMTNEWADSGNLLSIRLISDVFSTSPIVLSLSEDSFLSWRTQILSLNDSRKSPGPFVVVEVYKSTEEGLSLVISPLLRIYNESGLDTELRFRRPQEMDVEEASVLLRNGETIDDSVAAFDAVNFSGGSKKALLSLILGNFLLSFRPIIPDHIGKSEECAQLDWSEELKGEKSIHISGLFDVLNYRLRRTLNAEYKKSSFRTLPCSLIIEGRQVCHLHFLIHTLGREVPVMHPSNAGNKTEHRTSSVVLKMQKEIFILPTVRVNNLLQYEIDVVLTEKFTDIFASGSLHNFGKHSTISCGSSGYFYANPSNICFTVGLATYNSKCKTVNTGDLVKKLQNLKSLAHYLDVDLDFEGKYFANLRLSRGDRGILEATVFTQYTLKNDTSFTFFCCASNKKSSSWPASEGNIFNIPYEVGCLLHPMTLASWFLRSNQIRLRLVDERKFEALLDLDALIGLSELTFEDSEVDYIAKFGVSMQPYVHAVGVPAQVVCIVPRYVIINESNESILVRQCHLENDLDEITTIEGKQEAMIQMRKIRKNTSKLNLLDSLLRKHRSVNEDSLIYFQFCLNEKGYMWSGPICISSLGRFFLRFKALSDNDATCLNSSSRNEDAPKCAILNIVEEGSRTCLHFSIPSNVVLPYRIENHLHGASIMYHQKDFMESDLLRSGDSVEYVWDDLNLPHKLVVQIVDMHLSREISIDKVSIWKSFLKARQSSGLFGPLPFLSGRSSEIARTYDVPHGMDLLTIGYEVYIDGLTRVLRICQHSDSFKEMKQSQIFSNLQIRVSGFTICVLGNDRKDIDQNMVPVRSTILQTRLSRISLDSVAIDKYKYNYLKVQTFSVDEKWQGAPFPFMVKRSRHGPELNEDILRIIAVLYSTNDSVKQVKYSSVILQPIDLNVDEETLLRLLPFWRTSLSNSSTKSRRFYFKHLEIHPIKIRASFLPGTPYSSYNSAQETLRSLLHGIIKVPSVNNAVVELNGILLSHALLTFRDLVMKCMQHYSWYAIRAIYMAKGTSLLPPVFASIFDDSALSSLDVFFDPSDGSINLPGLTFGMFKFINKYINAKGIPGTKRYFGDLGRTIKTVGSNAVFAAVTEISDNVLKGAEMDGLNGIVKGFHQGIMKLAMEPSLLGVAVLEGGPDRRIKLDQSPGVDELYIEGYLQAMLDVMYKQEYLRVRVINDQVVLKNLPPNSSVINEIMEKVKSFLVSKALLKGDATSMPSRPFRHLQTESEWQLGPTILTLCEHLFVGFTIRILRREANKLLSGIGRIGRGDAEGGSSSDNVLPTAAAEENKPGSSSWGPLRKFAFSGAIAYVDGRLCRHIPHPLARRIVSGFLLSFLDTEKE